MRVRTGGWSKGTDVVYVPLEHNAVIGFGQSVANMPGEVDFDALPIDCRFTFRISAAHMEV